MGEQKKRAKKFKEMTDKAKSLEIEAAQLQFAKLAEEELLYECVRVPADSAVKIGDRAKLIDLRDRIEAFVNFVSVGSLMGNQVTSFRERFELDARGGGAVGAVVVEVSVLTPTFMVRVQV